MASGMSIVISTVLGIYEHENNKFIGVVQNLDAPKHPSMDVYLEKVAIFTNKISEPICGKTIRMVEDLAFPDGVVIRRTAYIFKFPEVKVDKVISGNIDMYEKIKIQIDQILDYKESTDEQVK